MVELKIGSTFFATRHRTTARWHITGEIISHSKVRIDRIWRDDNKGDWSLAWMPVTRDDDRIVRHVVLGEPDHQPGVRHPIPGSVSFDVYNPRHIFDYDGKAAPDTFLEETPKPTAAVTGDARIANLYNNWKTLRDKIDSEDLSDKILDVVCKALSEVEMALTVNSASSNIGIIYKMEVVDYYVTEYPLIETAEFFPQLIVSIKEDLENLK